MTEPIIERIPQRKFTGGIATPFRAGATGATRYSAPSACCLGHQLTLQRRVVHRPVDTPAGSPPERARTGSAATARQMHFRGPSELVLSRLGQDD